MVTSGSGSIASRTGSRTITGGSSLRPCASGTSGEPHPLNPLQVLLHLGQQLLPAADVPAQLLDLLGLLLQPVLLTRAAVRTPAAEPSRSTGSSEGSPCVN